VFRLLPAFFELSEQLLSICNHSRRLKNNRTDTRKRTLVQSLPSAAPLSKKVMTHGRSFFSSSSINRETNRIVTLARGRQLSITIIVASIA
jgi:hypothetical protein